MRPTGSIEGIETIQRLIALAQAEPVHLYEASRRFSGQVPREVMITSQSTLHFGFCKDEGEPRFLNIRSGLCEDEISMLDMNVIPNGYNDWYLFTDENKAKDYLA